MRKRSRIQSLSVCVGGLALTGLAGQGLAQVAVTGNLSTTPVSYGSNVPGTGALATQTINTSFGDSNYTGTPNGPDANGSELDAAYGVVQNGNLDLFFAGNYENNGNHLVVFIDDGAMTGGSPSGQNTLNISNGWTAAGMNNSVFSPGFNADLLLDTNDYQGQMYVDQYNLNPTGSTNSYLGSVSLTSGIGHGTLGGIGFGLNNSNTAGVTGDVNGGAATAGAAQAVSTGIEISIPMSALGNPTNIKVLAAVNGGNDGFMSNQFLPGLPAGTISVGSIATSTPPGPGPYSVAGAQGAFNFASTPNEFFSVPTGGVANGTWLNPSAGFSWGTAANWSNSYIPGVSGDAANFAGATAPSTVTLDAPRTVGSMSFDSGANPYTIAAGSGGASTVLTLSDPSGTAVINNYSGSNTISAPVVLNSNAAVTVINTSDTLTISGNISGTGGLSVNNPGNGFVVLSGSNSYGGGTTVVEGNLNLGSSTALPTGSALTLSAQDLPAGVLNLNGFGATVSSITVLTGPKTVGTGATAGIINTSTTPGTVTFTYAGSNANPSTLNNCNITDNSGSGGSTTALTVSSGSLTLTGVNSYGGITTVANGAYLAFSSATSAGTTFPSGGNAVNNGSLVLNDSVTVGTITGSGTTTITAGQNVLVTSISQAGGVVNDGNLTVFTGGTIGKITETGTAGGLNILAGTLQLAPNGGPSSQNVLFIQPGAVLDITNNKLFIDYGSGPDPIASIASWIENGFYNLSGPQIISSSIAADDAASGLSYGIGYADGADGEVAGLPSGEIEIMFTLLGDANLDGTVNSEDFTPFSHNLGQNGSWDQGDFNYDGTVNAEDFTPFSHNLGQTAVLASQGGPLAGSLTNVPEPASMAMMVMAGLGILRRRRRSSHDRD
jgi:autotransporter-associated beta strand protein